MTAKSSMSNPRNLFRRRRKNKNNNMLHSREKHVQGSEAVAVESQRVNAKMFNYPEAGFETWIENSLLYTMIRESKIFPSNTVLEAIEEEEYTQYFLIKQEDELQRLRPQIGEEENDNDSDSQLDSGGKTAATDVSYAQLTALLALAGEEWPSSSSIPQRLCEIISKQIIKYANKNELDREQELKELLHPLIDYAKGRGRQQALKMLPWFAALTVSTINPLAFYATYMSMLAANSNSLGKGDRADRNTINMAEVANRQGNVEKASLLDEDYYEDDE